MVPRVVSRVAASIVVAVTAAGLALARDSKSELQKDLNDESISPGWIYDDIDAGFARAVKEKKPVCVVFR